MPCGGLNPTVDKNVSFCNFRLFRVLRTWTGRIYDVFPRNMTYFLQNMQFSQYFKMGFKIFSLNLTGESDFFIPSISRTENFLWVVFNKI